MKTIPLTQGQVAIVDDKDYPELSKYKWHAEYSKGTKSFYARRNISVENGKRRRLGMHRQLLGLTDSKIHVDHVNHDTLDNRRENLRPCSVKQNLGNARRQQNNTSGFKGVNWNKKLEKWVARVSKKRTYLGLFNTAEEAAAAYNEAALQEYGDFAHLNEIPVAAAA